MLQIWRHLKTFKKILKIFLWVLLSIFGLLLLLCISVYLPPVQKFAINKVTGIVSESTDMRLSVGKFRLRFPLGISVDGAVLITPAGDTLVGFDRLKVDVSLLPLLTGNVRASGISLENASATYRDTVSAMLLRARLDAFAVRSATLALSSNSVRISRASLAGADVNIRLGEGVAPPPDTVAVDTTASAPWKFRLRRLDISGVKFDMTTSPQESRVAVDLPRGTIRDANVDLGGQNIDVRRIRLMRGDYGYFTGNTAAIRQTATDAPDDPAADTLPWTVRVGSVALAGSKAAYGSMYGTPSPGFDPRHIAADSVELLVEDVFWRGSDISAGLRKLELSERSGLRVTHGKADFSMTEKGMSLKDLDIATANSEIKAGAEIGAGIMEMAASAPVSAVVYANVGMGDISIFVPLDAASKRVLRGRSLTLDGDFEGTLGDLAIDKLSAAMPGRIEFNARGNIRSIDTPGRLSGQISFDGSLRDLGFAKAFIADTALRRRIGFPDRMTLKGNAMFSPDVYEIPYFTLAADTGRLDLKARLATTGGQFAADVGFVNFPLHDFLPHDSLGVATLTLTAEGQGFDPSDGMSGDADVKIERLDYKGFTYHNMELAASMSEGAFEGRLTSSNEALSLDLGIGGRVGKDIYSAALNGTVWRADIQRMGFSESPLSFTSQLDISAAASRDSTAMRFMLEATVDSTVVRYGANSQRIGRTTMDAAAVNTATTAKLRSGDLALDFWAPLNPDSLIRAIGSVGTQVQDQLASRSLHMDGLQRALPEMKATLSAGRGNVLREMAHMQNFDFGKVTADISTVDNAPLRINGEVNGLVTAGLTLDTLNLRIGSRGDSLLYALRLANRPGNVESLALIWIYGVASGNTANVNIYQRNRADSVGFRFGLDAQLRENAVRATIMPQAPTLGYEKWSLNENNYVEYDFDGIMSADLHLKGPGQGQYVNLTSSSMQDVPQGALRLEMAGIDIGNLIDLFPTAPPIGGLVSSDLTFGLTDGIVAAKGSLGVGSFTYNGQRVADIDATVDFQSDNTGRMVLDAGVDMEKRTALTANGFYTKEDMDFTVAIPYVPLSVAEAFLPEETARLSGSLDGNVRINGSPGRPLINGDLGFTGGKAEIEMIGTAYGISGDRITVSNGLLNFNGFGITAPNNRKLGMDGTLDISDFSKMRADLRVSARNFQAVNSSHIGGSQVYGKAALDLDITARGPVDALTVRGDIDLLGTTDVVYILRNQSENVRDEKQDIVDFVVFADSLHTYAADTVPAFRRSSVDLLVGVNMEDGLQATLGLDEQNENRVELVGGGELAYSMNSQGDMRLSGRYTLTGGTVYYKPPVISQKIFAVKDGSYVEWAGEPADPEFNVTATQTMKVTLESDSGSSKEVGFDISIAISGSLQGIDIKFDVAAPGDLEIQNELSSMSDEERMQQALTLLIYNQYAGLAYSSESGSFDARAQVNQFISKEINQWARNNLKGVDFSMGIDSDTDEAGNTHTDYSYSVSKSLFSDRVKVTIGGSVSDNTSSQDFADNLVEDLTLEYRLTRRDNMFLKVYRYNTQESILEGEITETGGGFLMRKKMNRFGDLFRINRGEDKRRTRIQKREERHGLREQEKTSGIDGTATPEDAPPPGDPADPASEQNQDTPLIRQTGNDG